MKKGLFYIAVCGLLSSCAVSTVNNKINLNTTQRRLNRQAEANANQVNVINKPILADLDVMPKRESITLKTTNRDMQNTSILFSVTPGSKDKPSGAPVAATQTMRDEAINRAQFKFMEDFRCDYLVDPIYKVETESTSESDVVNITVQVSAYPANYRKFSQPDSLPKSVYQMSDFDGRGIPLTTMAINKNVNREVIKKEMSIPAESGFFGFGGLGLYDYTSANEANLKVLAGNYSSSYNDGINICAGLFHEFARNGKVGFRVEGLLAYRSFDYSFTSNNYFDTTSFNTGSLEYKEKYTFVGLDIPAMLNFHLSDNFSLQAGGSLGLAFSAKYKTDATFDSGTLPVVEEDINDVGAMITGILGAQYELNSGLAIGARYTYGSWTSYGLTVGVPF